MAAISLSIFKSWKGRNAKAAWVNTYDLSGDAPLDDPSWVDAVNKFAFAETYIHLEHVHFLRAVISTWNQEATYRYENLRVIPLNNVGQVQVAQAVPDLPAGIEGALDLNFALQMNKNATLGRMGKVFFRGCLTVADVTADSNGKPTLSANGLYRLGGGVLGLVNEQYQNLPAGIEWVMMPSPRRVAEQAGDGNTNPNGDPETLSVRDVTALNVGGVVLLPRDHKFFDRRTAREKAAEAALLAFEAANPPVIEGEVEE